MGTCGSKAAEPEEVVVSSGSYDRTQHPGRAAKNHVKIVGDDEMEKMKEKPPIAQPVSNSTLTESESHDTLAQLNNGKMWKFYHDLDSIEHDEALKLKKFMQKLLSMTLPEGTATATRSGKSDSKKSAKHNLIHTTLAHTEIRSFGTCRHSHFDVMNFEGSISPSLYEEVLEVYRRGGKLSTTTVVRILKKAYQQFQKLQIMLRITVPNDCKLNVVGDLHGNIVDLIHIVEECGTPSATNHYLFNGDFVDRGQYSVEVMTLLLTLFVTYPDYVILNRGNHEEGPMTRVYGFEEECVKKYDELTYGMYVELFKYMPVFVIINEFIFVLHGGLFNDRNVRLEELEKIDRITFVGEPEVPYPASIEGLDAEGQWREYRHQLMRDALWSDPIYDAGMEPSLRGTGVHFGPDVAKEFMENNNLTMIVRSHECCQRGFYLPYSQTANPALHRKGYPLLCTIFSSSNYGGRNSRNGDNEGAYMVFMNHYHSSSQPVPNTSLFYSIHHFKHNRVGLGVDPVRPVNPFGEVMIKLRPALTNVFELLDLDNSGTVTKSQWKEVMERVTKLHVCWEEMMHHIVPANCLTEERVDYRVFLSSYSPKKPIGSTVKLKHANNMLHFYDHFAKLESLFHFFEDGESETITRQSLRSACEKLNTANPETERLDEVDDIFLVMNMSGSAAVDINDFFEAYRLSSLTEESVVVVNEASA